jgi:hypothetical protein
MNCCMMDEVRSNISKKQVVRAFFVIRWRSRHYHYLNSRWSPLLSLEVMFLPQPMFLYAKMAQQDSNHILYLYLKVMDSELRFQSQIQEPCLLVRYLRTMLAALWKEALSVYFLTGSDHPRHEDQDCCCSVIMCKSQYNISKWWWLLFFRVPPQ